MTFDSSLSQFFQSVSSGPSQSPSQAETVFRARAWRSHEEMGWPTAKTEAWRYTSAASLLKSEMQWLPGDAELTAQERQEITRWQETFEVVAIKNGRLVSSPQASPCLTVRPLADCWDQCHSLNWNWSDGFGAALAAVAQGGIWIDIKESFSRPLLIAHFRSSAGRCSSSVNVVSVAANCDAPILEMFLGEGENFSSNQSFVNVENNARLVYGRLTCADPRGRHFSDVQIHLHRSARLQLTNMNLGMAWSRSSLSAVLSGEGSEAQLNGIAFGLDQQHNDQRVEVRHLAPHTTSRQLFKGIWRDRARGILNGKIYIAPGAQQVDSAQLNHNLLLSKMAEADTKPELEVYADDVKANHGASIGRMDEEKLFYLLSRGIPRAEAVQLLAEGFIQDIVTKCESQIMRERMAEEIRQVLPRYARELEGANQ